MGEDANTQTDLNDVVYQWTNSRAGQTGVRRGVNRTIENGTAALIFLEVEITREIFLRAFTPYIYDHCCGKTSAQ
jgi:hypothetical protein